MATHLTRYPLDATASSGYSQKWTWSGWVKRGKLGAEQGIMGNKRNDNNVNSRFKLYFRSTDKLGWECKDSSGSDDSSFETNALFRDTNCWYHICFIYDSDNSTATERIKCYVNGLDVRTEYGGFSSDNQASSGFGTLWSSAVANYLGTTGNNSGIAMQFDGCMSHCHLTYGYRYEASTFGSFDSTTGEWKINVDPSVTYGSQGYFLLKNDNSVTDQSGEGNNYTATGTLTKTEDNPSNVFATNNSLWKQESSRFLNHTLGNTMISGAGSSTWYQTPATLAFNSGKFYWECKFNAGTNLDKNTAGVIDYEKTQESGQFQDKTGSVFYKNEDGGETRIDASTSSADYGTLAQNDILGVAVDMDAATPTVKFYKNGSLLVTANASSLSGKFVTPAQSVYTSGEYQVNYGNGAFGTTQLTGTTYQGTGNNGIFKYQPPTGYTALSTKGLNE